MDHINLPLVRTRSGAAAMWDQGGFDGLTGRAVVIAGVYGEKLRPYFTYRMEGHRPNARHALMPVYPGGHIVQVDTNPDETTVRVLQVVLIEEEYVQATLVAMAVNDSWKDGISPPKILQNAVDAACAAAARYGSVVPGYAIPWHEHHEA